MIERHQDYQLSIPTLPAGGLEQVPLPLDSDAPFALRLVRTRNLGPAGFPAAGFRFYTPREKLQSPDYRTDWFSDGQGHLFRSRGVVIYPQMIYPANSSILVDIQNQTGSPISNVRILFRGAKLFPDGAFPIKTYPAQCSLLPFQYPLVVPGIPVTGLSTVVPGLTSSATLNQILNINSDADFVYRYGVCDPFALAIDGGVNPPPQTYTELYVTIRDESRKPYSNEPIHVNDLFGQLDVSHGSTGNVNDPNVDFFPGIMRPELYLLKEEALYFDIYRDDSGLVNQFPVQLNFRFGGVKVFNR
jgi:hypothetical protein